MQNLPGASGGQAALTMLAKAEQDCFRFVASLCREKMFAVICCSHKMKTPTVSRSALSHQGHYCSRRGHVSSWQRSTPPPPRPPRAQVKTLGTDSLPRGSPSQGRRRPCPLPVTSTRKPHLPSWQTCCPHGGSRHACGSSGTSSGQPPTHCPVPSAALSFQQ